MKQYFSKKNRVLLAELVRTDFKLRYQDSWLGYMWSLLRPLLMFVILYVVFVKFIKIGGSIEHYALYLLMGIMLWNFFTEMTSQSLSSIVGRGDLIRKIRISRWLIVVSSSISALINLALNGIVLAVFITLSQVNVTRSILLLPLVLFEFYLFSLGVSLFLSAAYVKYRDMTYIWEVVLQAGFYATPILYPLTIVPSITIQKVLILNPLAQIVQAARYSTITQHAKTASQLFGGGWYMYIPHIIIVLVLIGGVIYFKRESKYFAENI